MIQTRTVTITRRSFLLILLWTIAFAATASASPAIHWRKVGHPWGARKIAVCTDGTIYAMNADRTIWRNRAGGADGQWIVIDYFANAESISCANQRIYVFTSDRHLYRNDGTDEVSRWVAVGRPFGAAQITAGTELIYFFPNPALYALNDDHTLWRSSSGSNGSWTREGLPGSADRIAVGGTLLEVRLFALNRDKDLYLNWGNGGCDDHWYRLDAAPNAVEIAARNATILYALHADRTLWVGSIDGDAGLYATTRGEPRRCGSARLIDVYHLRRGQNHTYTANNIEIAQLQRVGAQTLGRAFRCFDGPVPGAVAMHRVAALGPGTGELLVTDPPTLSILVNSGWRDDGTLCYVADPGRWTPLQDRSMQRLSAQRRPSDNQRVYTPESAVYRSYDCDGFSEHTDLPVGQVFYAGAWDETTEVLPHSCTPPAPPPPPPVCAKRQQTFCFNCGVVQQTVSQLGCDQDRASIVQSLYNRMVNQPGHIYYGCRMDDGACTTPPPSCGGAPFQGEFCCRDTGTTYYAGACSEGQTRSIVEQFDNDCSTLQSGGC